MNSALAAARGRRAAERLMRDRCVIRTPKVLRFNPATKRNDVDPASFLVVYDGKCRVRPRDSQDQQQEVGSSLVSTWSYMVSIPFAALYQGAVFLPLVDQVVEITASDDGSLVGQQLRMRQVIQGTDITARRMQCEVYAG